MIFFQLGWFIAVPPRVTEIRRCGASINQGRNLHYMPDRCGIAALRRRNEIFTRQRYRGRVGHEPSDGLRQLTSLPAGAAFTLTIIVRVHRRRKQLRGELDRVARLEREAAWHWFLDVEQHLSVMAKLHTPKCEAALRPGDRRRITGEAATAGIAVLLH